MTKTYGHGGRRNARGTSSTSRACSTSPGSTVSSGLSKVRIKDKIVAVHSLAVLDQVKDLLTPLGRRPFSR